MKEQVLLIFGEAVSMSALPEVGVVVPTYTIIPELGILGTITPELGVGIPGELVAPLSTSTARVLLLLHTTIC